ncbi:hypothetical protein Tco_1577078 [Tanacetum coccineum]
MDPYVTSTPSSTKLLIFDTGKFKQWKFRIQQYLQHEHYALWDVIKFGDSYKALAQDKSVYSEATPSSRSKGRIVAVTTEDMKKRRNDVKAVYFSCWLLPDEITFISSSNTNSGKSKVPTAQSFSTASGQVTTVSTKVATATFSHDTICAYIATQQSGSQIKYEDITRSIVEDIEEMDIQME